jgi:hypothetical protein
MKKCIWRRTIGWDFTAKTGCEKIIIFPDETTWEKYKFCPFCGKEIKLKS